MAKRFKKKLDERLVIPLLNFLKQGITPDKLALTVVLGLVLGLFPVIGITTILCVVVAFAFRLNMAIIQLINYFAYPLQFILIIPLIKIGEWILGVNPMPYSIVEMLEMVNNDFMLAMGKLWEATVLGIFAWALLIIPIGVIFFFILRGIFRKIVKETN